MTARPAHPAGSGVVAALQAAARAALHAPSVFNTQPWRWRITGDTLELYSGTSTPGNGAGTEQHGDLDRPRSWMDHDCTSSG